LAEDYGNETARLLADWDPYDQNTSSSFFDKEWMFGITDGFDIVIGNPPYIKVQNIQTKVKQNGLRESKVYVCKGKVWTYMVLFHMQRLLTNLIN
jgi:methylase of polypeptide subunit release factors